MSKGSRVSEEVLNEVHACIVDKKNPDPCIKKVLEEHGLDEDDKAKVLQKLVKKEVD